MNINRIFDEIILNNNTLSEQGREDIIYTLLDIYSKMPQPVQGVGVMTFAALSDKDMVLTLITAQEAFAVKYFLFCGKNINKIDY